MEWAFGNSLSIRALVIASTVAVLSTVALTMPAVIPMPKIAFTFGGNPANASIITVTSAEAKSASTIVTSIDDVHSQADLVAYANSLMRQDSRITQIQVGSHMVSMTYETSNRFLNIESISDRTRAVISADGTVSVSGSWMRPFFTHVARASSPSVGFSDIAMEPVGQSLSPETEARLLSRMQGRFRIGALQ